MNILRSNSFRLKSFLPIIKSINQYNLYSTRTLSMSSTSIDNIRSRFFAKKYEIEIPNKLAIENPSKNEINEIIMSIEDFISKSSSTLPNTESAIVLVPSFSLILPLLSMKLQPQHLIFNDDLENLETNTFHLENDKYIQTNSTDRETPSAPLSSMKNFIKKENLFYIKDDKKYLNFYILYFSPRATISSSISSPEYEEEEDDYDDQPKSSHQQSNFAEISPSRTYAPDRHRDLDEELRKINIDPSLLSDNKDFVGTPMVKIYKSFIYPRKNKNVIYDVKLAANRTALQISLAFRQYYTDLNSTFIRNTDKSKYLQQVKTFPVILVLDNIRSAFNVGSMFRTAETSGVEEVITCGITPHPPHPKLRKTALNSSDNVPTRHFEDIITALETLKAEGFTIISLETTKDSVKYTSIEYPKKVAIVVGNEITGVDQRALNMSDKIAEIPTFGLKNSLNVASCAPIVLYEIIRQWDN